MLSRGEEESARSSLEHADEELSGSPQEESDEGIDKFVTVLKLLFNKRATELVNSKIKQ